MKQDNIKNLLLWYKQAGLNTYFKITPDKEVVKNLPEELLAELKKEVLQCSKCELSRTRTNIVFGEGSPEAEIMFVGEAPGEEEDRQGRPFVGLAGQLLTKYIEAIGLKREEVYIANVLKCRPPRNRNPLPNEIERCSPYLFRQIEIIKPKIICALGSFAANLLIGEKIPISKIRGRVVKGVKGYYVFPTFHPAYLLRNPSQKSVALNDFKKLLEEVKRL